MDALEFKVTQAKADLTGRQLAQMLELDEATISRYRRGHVVVPGAVSVAMRALADGWRPA